MTSVRQKALDAMFASLQKESSKKGKDLWRDGSHETGFTYYFKPTYGGQAIPFTTLEGIKAALRM